MKTDAARLGLTDELISKLGSLKRIVVPPLNAVTANSADDPREIGRKLNTDAVLVGTVQRADGRLRVNAQLIRTNTGEQIWATGSNSQQPASLLCRTNSQLLLLKHSPLN